MLNDSIHCALALGMMDSINKIPIIFKGKELHNS